MPLRQQRNDGPRLIDDDIKQSSDVTSEHADIERFQPAIFMNDFGKVQT